MRNPAYLRGIRAKKPDFYSNVIRRINSVKNRTATLVTDFFFRGWVGWKIAATDEHCVMGKPRRNKSHGYRGRQSRLCRLDLLPLTFGSGNDAHVADRWVCWAYKIPYPFRRGVNSDELPNIIPRVKCTIDLKITGFANAVTSDQNDGRKTSRGFRYGSSLSAKPRSCEVFAPCAK